MFQRFLHDENQPFNSTPVLSNSPSDRRVSDKLSKTHSNTPIVCHSSPPQHSTSNNIIPNKYEMKLSSIYWETNDCVLDRNGSVSPSKPMNKSIWNDENIFSINKIGNKKSVDTRLKSNKDRHNKLETSYESSFPNNSQHSNISQYTNNEFTSPLKNKSFASAMKTPKNSPYF